MAAYLHRAVGWKRKQRSSVKTVLGTLIGFVLLIALCWGGYHLYVVLESRHLARRAAAYVGGGELRQAVLVARRSLQLDQSCFAAARVLADVAERTNDKIALNWRRRAVELKPDSIEDQLALANSALQFNDVETAEKVLGQIGDQRRQTAQYQASAARLAEAKRDAVAAEDHWSAAARLAPADKSYQLQLALALLRFPSLGKRDVALTMLKGLRDEPTQRAAATQALILDGITHHAAGQELIAMASELQSYPEASFADHLLYLDILRQLADPRFTASLGEVEKDAASKPAEVAAVVSWMNANKMSAEAMDFAHSLQEDVLSKWPVPLTVAESYGKTGDWGGLQNLLQDKNWGEFDFLRHAYLAHALRERGKPVPADREWAMAQKQAAAQPQFLSLLSRTISDWGWNRETIDLLWALTKHPETQLEAFEQLYKKYLDLGDSPGLYRVLMRLAELLPADRRIQNNLAQLCLLLNADVERGRKLAADLYAKESSNAAYASTYAYALYTEGHTDKALKIMNGLEQDRLSDPAVAVYYGVLLAAGGENDKAKEYLKLAASGKLLPEERELVTKTEDSLK